MPTELDHSAIESRIVAILQDNTSLYTTSAEANKLRLITKGHPFSHSWKDSVFPYAFVSYKNERTTLFGSRNTNETQGIKHIVTYDIVFAVNKESGRDAETALNDFQKTIMETLEGNVQLKHPTLDNDPKCVYSFANPDGAITETIGFEVQARTLSFICFFRTGTNTSQIVNSGNVTLTNATDATVFKLLFNVKPFITSAVTKRQLTDSTINKFFEPRDYAIEADMFLDYSELSTWIGYTVQTDNLPVPKSFQVAFPDKDGNTTTLSSTFRVSQLNPSASDDRDANIHIRLESVDGDVTVS